jgi:hypothetical protein
MTTPKVYCGACLSSSAVTITFCDACPMKPHAPPPAGAGPSGEPSAPIGIPRLPNGKPDYAEIRRQLERDNLPNEVLLADQRDAARAEAQRLRDGLTEVIAEAEGMLGGVIGRNLIGVTRVLTHARAALAPLGELPASQPADTKGTP